MGREGVFTKAIILAAGYGTRLGDMTKNKPKPMIKVGGKPVIEHIVQKLNDAGIKDIIINLHYLGDRISDQIGDRALYFYEPKLLGHNGTIEALREWLGKDSFFVINGDTLSDVDYRVMIKFHQGDAITALMDEWRCAGTWIYDSYLQAMFSGIPLSLGQSIYSMSACVFPQ